MGSNFGVMTPWQLFLAGGLMMWPILLCSVLALGIIMDRFWYLYSIKVDIKKFLESLFDNIKKNKIKAALELCAANHRAPIANVLKMGLLKYDSSRGEIKEAMEDASLYEIPKLESRLGMLATIAHTALLLGLLGTVMGMARCFQSIQIKSASMVPINPGDLAGGIWEALLTTVAGLMVAIPAFFAYNVLVSSINSLVNNMEKAATELADFLSQSNGGVIKESEPVA